MYPFAHTFDYQQSTTFGFIGTYRINDTSTSAGATWSSQKINTAINNAVSSLVNGAGTTLDTLKELAGALGNDANFAATIAAQSRCSANIYSSRASARLR